MHMHMLMCHDGLPSSLNTHSQIAYMNQINLIFLLEQFMSMKRSFLAHKLL